LKKLFQNEFRLEYSLTSSECTALINGLKIAIGIKQKYIASTDKKIFFVESIDSISLSAVTCDWETVKNFNDILRVNNEVFY